MALRIRFTCLLASLLPAAISAQETVPGLLKDIKAIGKEGKGNAAAAKAWQALLRQPPEALPEVIAGLDDAGPIAANWIRAAVDGLAEKTLASGTRLPADKLEAFIRDTKHAGTGRKLAFDWLARIDPDARDRLLPGMLDDPGAELRREAVVVLLAQAQEQLKKDKAGATATFQKILQHARDADQVSKAAAQLKELGLPVDLTRHFGFLTHWHLIGPFDNVKGVGFNAAYPPEKGFDLAGSFEGKVKEKVAWKEHVTEMPMGLVDLNKVYGSLKGAVVYGHTAIESPRGQPIEIRAATANAVRIYLNGEEVYFREEYHHGMSMDQHVGKGTLKKGQNKVLIKVCQNEQTEDWAKTWSFQLRICDILGAPVPLTVVGAKR